MGAIDVGDKVHLQVILIGAQGFGDHHRTQIGTADTDVDHMLDGLAGITLPLARDDLGTEALHLLQYGLHFRHHILAIDQDFAVGAVTQGDVQHGTAFGLVDGFTVEHGVDGRAQIGLFGQIGQQLEGLFADDVLGVVDQDLATEGGGEVVKTLGIGGKQILDLTILVGGEMGFQRLPGLGLGRVDVFHRFAFLRVD